MSEKAKYVLIYTDGRAENVKDGWTWYDLLMHVYAIHSGAGSNTPLPSAVLRHGRIIVESAICDTAWPYARQRRELFDAADREARESTPEPKP